MSNPARNIMIALLLICFVGASAHHEKKAKTRERIQTLKKMKLIEHLDLDEAAAEKFFVKYNKLESEVSAKSQEIDQVVHKIDVELQAEKPNVTEVNKLSENLLKLQGELNDLKMKRYREIRSVLTEVQYGRYLVFEKTFYDQLKDKLMDFRDRKGKHKGRGRGSD